MTTLTRADVLEVCAVILQRCRLTAGELAAHMGEPLRTAALAAPAPAAAHPGRLTPRQSEVLALCHRADGLSTLDLKIELGIASQTAFEYLQDLELMGRAVRVRMSGRACARYFASPAHALAWSDSQLRDRAEADAVVAAATAAVAVARRAARQAVLATSAPVARPAPVAKLAPVAKPVPVAKPAPRLPQQGGTVVGPFVPAIARPSGETIIPAHVVIQRAASKPDHRFTVAPDQVLTGGFSTSLPGINPITGKAWGSAS